MHEYVCMSLYAYSGYSYNDISYKRRKYSLLTTYINIFTNTATVNYQFCHDNDNGRLLVVKYSFIVRR